MRGLALFVGVVVSIPAFHHVNDFDLSGQVCPLPDMFNHKCSPLCVLSLELCPSEVKLQCKEGFRACLDGTCQASCEGISNVCACHPEQPTRFVPCARGTVVDIKAFNGSDEKNQVSQVCSSQLQVEFRPWSEEVELSDAGYWAECPPVPPRKFTFHEPIWIPVYSILSLEFVVVVSWMLFKNLKERKVGGILAQRDPVDEGFVVNGFRNDLFGSLALVSVGLVSVGWLLFLGALTADYYGGITGKPYGIALESYANSSSVFIGVWVCAVTWFTVLVVFKPWVRNWFRIKTGSEHAQFVQIDRVVAATLLLDDGSNVLRRVREVEARVKRMLGLDVSGSTVPLNTNGSKYFTYQCQRFVYREKGERFLPEVFEIGNQASGLSGKEANARLEVVGPNLIQVHVPSFAVALFEELSGLFYLYQFSILWLFYYLDYWIIGVVDTGLVFLSGIVKVVVRLKSENRIKQLAEHQTLVQILRDGQWGTYSSGELVAGDVFRARRGSVVPCDAVLLQGQCICDESSLTGEPNPVRKLAIADKAGPYQHHKVNTLFAGTSFCQVSDDAIAIVHKTAISTDKGQLIINILFPNPVSFIFDEQLKIVILILGVWGIVLFSLAMWLQKAGGTVAWFYGMFCLSQILSPLLPAALVAGQSVAAAHLRNLNIFCVDLPRIMVAGKVQIFCFDKTGTLTHEGLDYFGSCPLADGKLSALVPTVSELPKLCQLAQATCHSVAMVDGEAVGNPVDIEMFKSTNWQLVPSSHVDSFVSPSGSVAHVVKRFEFIHSRASMSAAVLDPASNHTHMFVKGSFERLGELMTNVPEDYYTTASKLASEGCYVLALAHRDLGVLPEGALEGKTRDDLEKGIQLLGLIVFRNELKSDTTSAIRELKAGGTRTVMITGDTALTGIHIAQACEMIPKQSTVYLGDVNGDVVWRQVGGNDSLVFDTHAILSMLPKDGVRSTVELAVTGNAFRQLSKLGMMPALLLNTRVFSRMTPQDKVECVNLHMARGITAMCGDGGNDCGALSAAHVGLALSEAEASIVSPFSSNVRSIRSCVQLLRHGRAALANSFASYKYMILYGETMAWLKIHFFYFTLSLSMPLWIIVDAFVAVGFSIALTQSKPSSQLSSSRPTSRLLGPETLASTIGMTLINGAFVMGGFGMLFRQPFFKCHEFDARSVDMSKWEFLGDNFEAELIGIIVLFHFVNSAFIFNLGYKFRQAFWRNYSLLSLWVILVAGIVYVLLADPNWLGCFIRMNCGDPDALVNLGYPRPNFNIPPYNIPHRHNVLPHYFRYTLLAYCLINAAITLGWELLVVLGPVRNYLVQRYPQSRLELKL